MSVQTVAGKFMEMVNQGKDFEVMRKMYDPEIISVEADGSKMRGQQPVIHHSEVRQGRTTVHSGQLRGPYFSGPDRFAVHFTIDVTRKDSGTREIIEEVGLYTVNDQDKIVHQQFFYDIARWPS